MFLAGLIVEAAASLWPFDAGVAIEEKFETEGGDRAASKGADKLAPEFVFEANNRPKTEADNTSPGKLPAG